jgi:hypothetical protein
MQTFSKSLNFALLALLLVLNSALFVSAQSEDLFSSPLDSIENRLDDEGVEVIDFSKSRLFGNLTKELVERLQLEGIKSLAELAAELLEEGFDASTPEDVIFAIAERLSYEIDQNQSGQRFIVDEQENLNANFIFNEMYFTGESQINTVIITLVNTFRTLIAGLAILFMIIYGMKLIMARGEENKITESKKGLTYAAVGLVGILLIERIVMVIYGTPGTENQLIDFEATQRFSDEVLGVVSYVKSLVGIIATFFLLVAGMRMITATGQEEKMTEQKRAFTWVMIGIVLMLISEVIVDNIFIQPSTANLQIDTTRGAVVEDASEIAGGNIATIINVGSNLIKFGLGFVGLIALGALVYGSGLLITNYANEEQVEKAKKIIKNALIGIVVILVAYAVVTTMIGFGEFADTQ